jgi:hypothetical protein
VREERTGLLVDLDGGLIGFDADNFSDEGVVAYTDLLGLLAVGPRWKPRGVDYQFVHSTSDHVLRHDDGTTLTSRLAFHSCFSCEELCRAGVPRDGVNRACSGCSVSYERWIGRYFDDVLTIVAFLCILLSSLSIRSLGFPLPAGVSERRRGWRSWRCTMVDWCVCS